MSRRRRRPPPIGDGARRRPRSDALRSARRGGHGRGAARPRPPDQAARQPRPARGRSPSSSPASPGAPRAGGPQGDRRGRGRPRRHAQGVSAYPSEVTAQMVANFVAGGAAINVLAAGVGASVTVVDVGVAGADPAGDPGRGAAGGWSAPGPRRDRRHDRRAGDDRATRRCARSTSASTLVADAAPPTAADLLGLGEMGIGNTTAASAITAVLTGRRPTRVTGRGTGVDDAGAPAQGRGHRAGDRGQPPGSGRPARASSPPSAGSRSRALVGVILGAAARARPGRARRVHHRRRRRCSRPGLAPALAPRLIAAHRSRRARARDRARAPRPASRCSTSTCGSGEGSGAALAMGLVDAAVRIRDGMATFESAAVAGPADDAPS